jgi:hypothetical protein
MTFSQMASKFGHYPYRFCIRHSPKYEIRLVPHEDECWLCVKGRKRKGNW